MGRAPLAFEPTYRIIVPGRDAYVRAGMLNRLINPVRKMHSITKADADQYNEKCKNTEYEPLARSLIKQNHNQELSNRYWMFRRQPTTVGLSGNRFVKSLEPFNEHKQSEIVFYDFLRECAQHGVQRPSNYGDVFHELYHSESVPYSINKVFMNRTVGGWQAALVPGIHFGTFRRYDLNSAYLGAIKNGLPDISTYRRSVHPFKRKHSNNGVFLVRLLSPSWKAPFPFNQMTVSSTAMATAEEIETYNLRIGEVIDGVTWDGLIDPTPIIDAVKKVTFWKLAARSYWGQWGQTVNVQCVTANNTWPLRNRALNLPWAHHIVSNIKLRLWPYTQSINAVHVFVDSIITRDILPTGTDIGDFRCEKEYPAGIVVRGTGAYGDILEDQLEKMAGVPQGSTRRNNPVPEWKAVQTA